MERVESASAPPLSPAAAAALQIPLLLLLLLCSALLCSALLPLLVSYHPRSSPLLTHHLLTPVARHCQSARPAQPLVPCHRLPAVAASLHLPSAATEMADMNVSSVPAALVPRDELREGLGTLRSDALISHPVEKIQLNYAKQERANHKYMLAKVYGSHLPVRLHMEEKILSQIRRFPGLPSSHLGLETILGLEHDIEFGDYLNRPELSERHVQPLEEMERRLGDRPDRSL